MRRRNPTTFFRIKAQQAGLRAKPPRKVYSSEAVQKSALPIEPRCCEMPSFTKVSFLNALLVWFQGPNDRRRCLFKVAQL
jgi:hypothetical protein